MLFDVSRMGVDEGNPSSNDKMGVRRKEYMR
jgi:hypothetical protein